MSWKPIGETYLVQPDEIKVSCLVPEHLKKNVIEMMTGTIVSAGWYRGSDGTVLPLIGRPGDKIMFGSKVGAEIKINGETLLLIADANVLLVEAA